MRDELHEGGFEVLREGGGSSERSALAQLPSAESRTNGVHDVRAPDTRYLLFMPQDRPSGAATSEFSFGPFRVRPAQFLLLEGNAPRPSGVAPCRY